MTHATPVEILVTHDDDTSAPSAQTAQLALKGRLKAELADGLSTKGAGALYAMDHILRQAGADRVDESASKKLRSILLDNADDLVFRAKILARHAGRTKITAADIRLAKTQSE